MKMKNTKQVILEKALELFSVQGYEGVSVVDIADAVGIKAASLYKHYKGKQDIFDSIITEMSERYQSFTSQIGIEGIDPVNAADQYINTDEEELIKVGTRLFLYYLHDEYAAKFRKMLTVEQYKNPMASKLYVEQYIDSPLSFQSVIFEMFMKQNYMKTANPKIVAMHFYAPIFLMLSLCDNCPDRESEALEQIRQHIIQFSRFYMAGGQK